MPGPDSQGAGTQEGRKKEARSVTQADPRGARKGPRIQMEVEP